MTFSLVASGAAAAPEQHSIKYPGNAALQLMGQATLQERLRRIYSSKNLRPTASGVPSGLIGQVDYIVFAGHVVRPVGLGMTRYKRLRRTVMSQ
jgi:hypothetical protein